MCRSSEEIVQTCAPRLLFNKNEPFFPRAVGWSIYRAPGRSASFRRDIVLPRGVAAVIEYAIFYDYDIQHLYDLEHVWIYVAADFSVSECEASFHGKIRKALKPDHGNLCGRSVTLYVQPGKHAMAEDPARFRLHRGYAAAVGEGAGAEGFLCGEILNGSGLIKTKELDSAVYCFLQSKRFPISPDYVEKSLSREIFMPTDRLLREIPCYLRAEIGRLRTGLSNHETPL